FAPRCERAEEVCTREFPPFVQLNEEHFSLCHFAEEVYAKSCEERDSRRAVTTATSIQAKMRAGEAPAPMREPSDDARESSAGGEGGAR
ncbi:MAG TPA: hypothetical protein VEQ42_05480, partial [Pyrinomonadaceae bacterium]|nr:hypothetical protein [Pyrinomonadaceae bacterium]